MRQALNLAWKETRDIMRERSIVLALFVQLFIAAFSAFITVGLVGLYDPASIQAYPDTEVAYVGPGGFDAYLAGESNIDLVHLNLTEAVARFERGDLFAVVQEDYTDPDSARSVTLLLPDSEFRTTLAVNQFKSLLRDYERDLRLDRQDRLEQDLVIVETGAPPTTYFGFAYAILLPLLVTTPVFLAGAITGDSFNDEINTHAFGLLRSAPISTAGLLLGKLAAPVVLVPLQVLLWVGLLAVNGIGVSNLPLLLLAATLMGLVLCGVGVVLAVTVQRQGQMQAAYAAAVLVLGVASILLPLDPFNLVARIAVDTVDAAGLATIGAYALAAALTTWAAVWSVDRRARHGVL